MLNPVFTILIVCGALFLLVVELVGVFRKQPGDTITENWRAADEYLKRQPAIRWFYRIFTAGILLWAALHFLVGAN